MIHIPSNSSIYKVYSVGKTVNNDVASLCGDRR